MRTRGRYTILGWLFDCFMVLVTCGLWLIRIYVREQRTIKYCRIT